MGINMMLSTVCGNEKIVGELKQALSEKRLMHAVLICGAKGTGAGYLAKCLAADYLYPSEGAQKSDAAKNGAKAVMSEQSGEYIVLKGENATAEIKIDNVRNVRKNLHSTALSSNFRVVHIKNAQKLNSSSANALLKVLEEPPENVLFILNAHSEAALMQTIRSRCSVYNMGTISPEQCTQYLLLNFKNYKGIKEKAPVYSKYFGGKIGVCAKMLAHKNAEKILLHLQAFLDAAVQKNAYELSAVLSNYEKDKISALEFLEFLSDFCAYTLRNEQKGEKAKAAVSIIENAHKTMENAHKNANIKLILSAMVVKTVKAH